MRMTETERCPECGFPLPECGYMASVILRYARSKGIRGTRARSMLDGELRKLLEKRMTTRRDAIRDIKETK